MDWWRSGKNSERFCVEREFERESGVEAKGVSGVLGEKLLVRGKDR